MHISQLNSTGKMTCVSLFKKHGHTESGYTVADGKTTQSGKLAPQQICAFWGLLFFFFSGSRS